MGALAFRRKRFLYRHLVANKANEGRLDLAPRARSSVGRRRRALPVRAECVRRQRQNSVSDRWRLVRVVDLTQPSYMLKGKVAMAHKGVAVLGSSTPPD